MNLPCAVRIEVLQPVNFDSIGQKESNVKEQERADWKKVPRLKLKLMVNAHSPTISTYGSISVLGAVN